MTSSKDECIVVFARTPLAGQSKTRLIPALGPEGAAELYAAFLEDWLPRCIATAPTIVYAADEHLDEYLKQAPWCPEVEVRRQCAGDLGVKMQHAFGETLDRFSRVLLVGSDLPLVPQGALREALGTLEENSLAFGPCEDGGYWCVAANTVPDFLGVRWSCEFTLADTLLRNPNAGLTSAHGDVDTPEDLRRLRKTLREEPSLAPATVKALQALL